MVPRKGTQERSIVRENSNERARYSRANQVEEEREQRRFEAAVYMRALRQRRTLQNAKQQIEDIQSPINGHTGERLQ